MFLKLYFWKIDLGCREFLDNISPNNPNMLLDNISVIYSYYNYTKPIQEERNITGDSGLLPRTKSTPILQIFRVECQVRYNKEY